MEPEKWAIVRLVGPEIPSVPSKGDCGTEEIAISLCCRNCCGVCGSGAADVDIVGAFLEMVGGMVGLSDGADD